MCPDNLERVWMIQNCVCMIWKVSRRSGKFPDDLKNESEIVHIFNKVSIKCLSVNSFSCLEIWESTISSPKFGTSIENTAYEAYLDHAYAKNLAKPPFMRICRKFEN